MTANVLRILRALFGLELESQRYCAFMASSTLPWQRLWRVLWGLIPNPTTAGQVMVAHFGQPVLVLTGSWFGNDGPTSLLELSIGHTEHKP